MAENQQLVTITIPLEYTSSDRVTLGKRIISFIKERTNNNLDKDNKRFKNYSDSYASSLDFKIAGKSQTDPNLQLTGDMLGTLDVLNHSEGVIQIGYQTGDDNDRAAWQRENKQSGYPKRDFLGIADKDLQRILAENPPSSDNTTEQQSDEEVKNELVQSIFKMWGML